MMRLGIIGCGAMARTLLNGLQAAQAPLKMVICLSTPRSLASAQACLQAYPWDFTVSDRLEDFLAQQPDLVVEAAGQEAVRRHGAAILAEGIDFGIASVGCLTDDALHQTLLDAARSAGARLHILPGAVGGVDILAAARLSGLAEVLYTSRKPPMAWKGTKAEACVSLDNLEESCIFFQGSARDAAKDYPQNANVAATIALAGVGLDHTQVQLIADPTIQRNIHEVRFVSGCAEAKLYIEGKPAPDNPKTSQTAGFSLARFVLNHLNQEAV